MPPDPPPDPEGYLPDLDTSAYPAVPAFFAAFNPPVADVTDPGAPQIAEWTRQANNGDTIALTGEDL